MNIQKFVHHVRELQNDVTMILHKIMVLLGLRYTDEELEVLKHIKPGMKVVGRGGLIK
jgi:hypothetical protein